MLNVVGVEIFFMINDTERPIMVVGVPRSGTSVVAGILHYLGVNMGQYYLRPDSQNPLGYFEDAQLLEIDFKYFEKDRKEWKKKTKEYLGSRLSDKPWGWKSPQLSVTLEYVRELFEEMKLRPNYIWVQREQEKVILSQIKHHGKDSQTAKEEVMKMSDNLKKCLIREKVLTLTYEEVLANPREAVKNIIDYLALEPSQDQVTRAVLSVIQPPPKEGESIVAVPSKLY